MTWDRNVVLFFSGQLTSRLGDAVRLVAVPWLLLQLTGSPLALGLGGIAGVLPFLIFGLFGGIAADRFDRRRLMIVADLIRAGLAMLIPALLAVGALAPWHIYLATFLSGVAGTFFYPAQTALLPMITSRAELVRVNAAFSLGRQIFNLVGTGAAGLIVAVIGPAPALVFDGATFAVSALSSIAIRIRDEQERSPETPTSILGDLRDGARFMATHTIPRVLVLVAVVFNGAHLPAMGTFLPLFVADALRADAAAFGAILSADSAGLILGFLAVVPLSKRFRPGQMLAGGILLLGVGMVAFSSASSLPEALAIAFLMGLAGSATNPTASALLQGAVPSEVRGRLAAAMIMAAYLLSSVGMIVGPPAIDALGLRTYYVLNAAIVLAIGLGLFAVRSVRQLELGSDETADPQPTRT